MISVSQAITDLKTEFEGGSSFKVDWYNLLRRGGQNLVATIRPQSLKRTVPIYGGLTRSVDGSIAVLCPDDLLVPSAIYGNDGKRIFSFPPSAAFHSEPYRNSDNLFTIETVNGVKQLVVRKNIGLTVHELNSMDSASGLTSDSTLTVNQYNFLSGTGALQRSFADSLIEISEAITSVDLSVYSRGVVVVPLYVADADKIASVTFVLETSSGNYYTLSTSSVLRNGWNTVLFAIADASSTGTPDLADITTWKLRVTATAGATQTVIIDRITVQKSQFFLFEYYSKYLFRDGTTGEWKATPVSGDNINLDDDDAIGALHYETAILTYQAAAFNRVDSGEKPAFEMQLARKYAAYREKYPSSELPPSYNIAPLPYEGAAMPYPLSDRIGEFVFAETSTSDLETYVYADNITPSGVIDGSNATFTLPHTPNPVSSLMLYLNGALQTNGADYSLSGDTITYTTPPDLALASAPHVAFYRYSS